jgi:hypothetical protein
LRAVACQQCASEVPLRQTFRVFERTPLCEPCADADLAARNLKKVPAGSVVRNIDPTICSTCEQDFGSVELRRAGSAPLCELCYAKALAYPFPNWVKASFAAVLVLVAVSLGVNARYFYAYFDIKKANAASDVKQADALFASASKRVPESQALANVASFYHGLRLLYDDRSADAVPFLEKARDTMGEQPEFRFSLTYARAGAAFDRHDYDGFLTHAKELAEQMPKDSRGVAQVASAYACKYAVTGADEYRRASLDYLEKAKSLAGPEAAADYEEYAARIRHRLETREILTKAEYDRRFHSGKEPRR